MRASIKFGMRLRSGVAVLAAAALMGGGTIAKAEEFLTIGTGGVTGIYYAVGGGICRLVNQGRKEHGIRCSVESTGGSVYNLRTMRQGELEMGIVQSDWQYHALNGTSLFEENGPDEELRSLFSLHPDTVIIAARTDAGITSLDDLGGKSINLGNPGSGTRGTAEVLVDALGWDMDHFGLVTELKSAEQSSALCDNTIDAFLMVAGNPVANVLEAATTCDINIIAVEGKKVDQLIDSKPYYGKVTIPGGLYRGVDEEVPSFGLPSTFVTSTKVPEETVYVMVKAVFDNFDTFKTFHPAFANLKKEEMVVNGLSAPMHPGAERYFREVGLLQ
ncbi:TAXI family TRAP transporter solute-binding subunit [uncultured Roseovarius sp.]|uniref:TAXI family TRAP transporter solute-binding subunit n=1 Tax=uncultured Roseovarius sp. TaxID=293344 RepID=UPI002635817B|nr:TAXI family TRAP transporter solute-binding subunit [uncultured Roseovarius sp.]